MLTGPELIKLVKDNPDLNRTQVAKAAGYVRTTEEGKEQVLIQRFYDAVLTAQGMPIKKGKSGMSVGKKAQHKTTVHATGILLVGRVYTTQFGAEPGDVFGIEVREDGIWLPLLERDLEVRTVGGVDTAASVVPAGEPQDELEDADEEELVAAYATAA